MWINDEKLQKQAWLKIESTERYIFFNVNIYHHEYVVFPPKLITTDQSKKKKKLEELFLFLRQNFIYQTVVILFTRLMTPLRLKYSSFCDIS